MRLVILESPYAGDVTANEIYARKCLHDCLTRGEAPIASHLLYTQPNVLDDSIPEQRKLGIDAGHAWYRVAEACVVYVDRGISKGMVIGMEVAKAAGIPIEQRKLEETVITGNDSTMKFEVGKKFKTRGGATVEITRIADHPGYNWLTGVNVHTKQLMTFTPQGTYSDFVQTDEDLIEEVKD